MLVFVADAVVDEDAMVVEFRYAVFTDATMLRAGGFEEFASTTGLAGVENGEVVRVESHCVGVIRSGDISGVCGC